MPYTFGGRFSGRHYPTGRGFDQQYSIDETKRAQPHKCKGQRVAGCLFRGAAELKFCLTPKGTAAKSIWQHVAENPCVAASASFPACKEATFKFHICRIPRGCPGRLRRWSPSGLRWRKQSQAWQLYLLSCTCELQSSWASMHRRPPGDHRRQAINIFTPAARRSAVQVAALSSISNFK